MVDSLLVLVIEVGVIAADLRDGSEFLCFVGWCDGPFDHAGTYREKRR